MLIEREFEGKTVTDATIEACKELGITRDELNFEVGDCCIVIKPNGTIGKVILPEMNNRMPQTEGYKKMLKIIDILKPGARKEFTLTVSASGAAA